LSRWRREGIGDAARRLLTVSNSAQSSPGQRRSFGNRRAATVDDQTHIVGVSKETSMSVARVTEIISSSNKSFEDAIEKGIARAAKTLKNVEGAWVKQQKVIVKKGKVSRRSQGDFHPDRLMVTKSAIY
jgi:flavin-binding protein dodecin